MGKNWFLIVSVLSSLGSVAAGCDRSPLPPHGYQGVLELEQHVLSFEAQGLIERIDVDEGDSVYAGMPLAELDPSLAERQREARRADVDVARAELALLEAGTRPEDVASLAAQVRALGATETLASKTLERARYLEDQGATPVSDVDRAQADVLRVRSERQALEQRLLAARVGPRQEEIARARARLASAEAAVRVEDEKLTKYLLLAPLTGRVVDVHVEEGELASSGTRAVTLADPTHPYVDAFIPEGEIAGVKVGSRATLRVDATSEAFSAVVEHVASKTEFTPRFLFSERERPNLVVRVRVRVDDPQETLHAGVPAFVEIERALGARGVEP